MGGFSVVEPDSEIGEGLVGAAELALAGASRAANGGQHNVKMASPYTKLVDAGADGVEDVEELDGLGEEVGGESVEERTVMFGDVDSKFFLYDE